MRRARWLGGAELHRPPQRSHGDVDGASAPGAHPGLFELTRELLVRPAHQRGAVPHAAVGIGIERRGERLVHTAALLHAGALPDRGAHQRVPETDGVDVEVDQRRLDGRLRRVEIQRCRRDDGSGLEDLAYGVPVAERGDQQHQAGGIGKIRDARDERALQPLGQRQAAGQRRLAVGMRGNRRQFEERERISGGLTQHAVACGRWKARGRRAEQFRGRRVVEAGKPVLRQPGIDERRGVPVARGGQQDNRVGLDPPGNESEHICGRTVEPVRVLDDQQHRGITGDVRDEVERGHRDPVVLRRHLSRQSERGVERVPLDRRQLDYPLTHRPEQLMQPGKRQVRFALHASGPEHRHPALARCARRDRQQPRLADARLTAKHQRLPAVANLVQK